MHFYETIEVVRALPSVDRLVKFWAYKHGCDVLDSRAFRKTILLKQ